MPLTLLDLKDARAAMTTEALARNSVSSRDVPRFDAASAKKYLNEAAFDSAHRPERAVEGPERLYSRAMDRSGRGHLWR